MQSTGWAIIGYLHALFGGLTQVLLHVTVVLTVLYLAITLVVLLFVRRRPYPYVADESLYPRVTIQIPTYNELAALNCAQRCLDFDYPTDRYDILIGDDSDRASVSAEIDAFAVKNTRVEVCRRGKNIGYKPGNLNNMLPRSKGDYILIFDSDFLPERDFLRKIVSPVIRNPSLAGVQARWRIVNAHQNGATILGASIVHTLHAIMLPFIRMFTQGSVFCGSAELVRKDELIRLGGWRAGSLTEDIDYSLRVFLAKKRIYYLDDLDCGCEVPQTQGDLFKQQMRWAYGVTRSFVDHGRELLLARAAGWRARAAALLFGSGYLMTVTVMCLVVLGILSTVTGIGVNAGDDQGGVWTIVTLFKNVALGGGLLVATLCAGFVSGLGVRGLGKLLAASFSVGFVLIYYVTQGICTALAGRPMMWFMLAKIGNKQRL